MPPPSATSPLAASEHRTSAASTVQQRCYEHSVIETLGFHRSGSTSAVKPNPRYRHLHLNIWSSQEDEHITHKASDDEVDDVTMVAGDCSRPRVLHPQRKRRWIHRKGRQRLDLPW